MTPSLQSHDTSIWLQIRTSQQTKEHAVRSLFDGLSGKYDALWASSWHKSNATKATAGDEVFCAFQLTADQQQLIYLLQPSERLGVRCDRNKDYCHLGVRCTHTKPRSSLSAKMCHRGRLTVRRMLHAWVFYTDCESIAIFQWQLQDVFEEQKNNLCSVESSRGVTARWKVSGGLGAFLVFILQNHIFNIKTSFSLIVTLSCLSEHTLMQNRQV